MDKSDNTNNDLQPCRSRQILIWVTPGLQMRSSAMARRSGHSRSQILRAFLTAWAAGEISPAVIGGWLDLADEVGE